MGNDDRNPSYRWDQPRRGLAPRYFPLPERVRFEYAGTRWTLVGFDRVPLWRPDYGHGYHALYRGDDGSWAEWRFQGRWTLEGFKAYHENEPFRLIPEETLPDWARARPRAGGAGEDDGRGP